MPTLHLPDGQRADAGRAAPIAKRRIKARPLPVKPVGGRPPYDVNKEDKLRVTIFRSCGLSPPDIAVQLGISLNTLKKYFGPELANGQATIVSRIGAQVVKKALAGDNGMIVFYLKNHGGDAWKDKQRLEHTGADGAPLQPPNLIVSFLEAAPSDEGP